MNGIQLYFKIMNKTIQAINSGLLKGNVHIKADGSNPYEAFSSIFSYLDKIDVSIITRTDDQLTHAIEYVCDSEQFIIKINKGDWGLILRRYCSDGKLLGTLDLFFELRDSGMIEDEYSIYKFVDITQEIKDKLN